MNKKQIILVSFGLIITVLLFFLGETKTPMEDAIEKMQASAKKTNTKTQKDINFAPLIETAKLKLTPLQQDTISIFENQLAESSDKESQILAIKNLANKWDAYRSLEISTYYYNQLADKKPDYNNLVLAGNKNYATFQIVKDSLLNPYFVDKAINFFEKSIKLEPDSLINKVKLASCYVEGKQAVMQGVLKLREVTEVDSLNIPANLILGRLGVFSGQFDKAVNRLKIVVEQEPTNTEALYYLGDAYVGMGDKKNALKYFEQCKTTITNPQFAKELDNYINKIINQQ